MTNHLAASFARHTGRDVEADLVHAGAISDAQPPPDHLSSLLERRDIMFSGKTGAPVASGLDGSAGEASVELALKAVSLIDDLPDELAA